jgi:hypothetical protein
MARPSVSIAALSRDGAAELLMQALEQPGHAVLGRAPPAAENAAVDARVHMADNIRLHFRTTAMSQFTPGQTVADGSGGSVSRKSALRAAVPYSFTQPLWYIYR